MKATYRTQDGRITFDVTGETAKDLFKAIAQIQASFEADSTCGLCSSNNIQLNVRSIDDNEYYALLCVDCGATLGFGQHKKGGTLFVKRMDPHGSLLPNNGWRRWTNRQMAQEAE